MYRGHAWNDLDNAMPLDESLRFNARIRYNISPKVNIYLRGESLTGNRSVEAWSFDYLGVMVFGGIEAAL